MHAVYFGLARSLFTGQKYGRLKYSKIQRTNGIEKIVYFTRVVTNERKFSWRWNIVAKLLQGMKNNLWKNKSKIIFRCLVRALWKCTKSPIEIMQIRYVLADFELSYFFFQNKNSLELLNIFFENDSPKGLLEQIQKKDEFLLLSPDSRKLLTTSLKTHAILS